MQAKTKKATKCLGKNLFLSNEDYMVRDDK